MVKYTISTIYVKEVEEQGSFYMFYIFDESHQLIRTTADGDLEHVKYLRDLYILLFSNGIILN